MHRYTRGHQRGHHMSISGITASIVAYQSQKEELPEELWHIIYGFFDSEGLTTFFNGAVSKATVSSINDYVLYRFRTDVVKASQIRDSYQRAKQLEKLGRQHACTNYGVVQVTADQVEVDYIKIEYLCEIGKALAAKGKRDASEKVFNAASVGAEAITSYYIRALAFKDLGVAQRISHAIEKAKMSFSKADDAVEYESCVYIKAQLKERIDKERRLLPA